MSRRLRVQHQFVEFIPQELEFGTIYVSTEYATCSHLCLCGCGTKVVTPLAPTEWRLTFDGETISLSPSIGNWSFDCQSHYWIKRSRVDWAAAWSKEKVRANRVRDQELKREYFNETEGDQEQERGPGRPTLLARIKRRLNS